MLRRDECIDIDTYEDTMTKEVAAPTVTCIIHLHLLCVTPSCTVKVTKGVNALAKKQRISPGLNILYCDDRGDH